VFNLFEVFPDQKPQWNFPPKLSAFVAWQEYPTGARAAYSIVADLLAPKMLIEWLQ
jgi:hypothetical protein